MFGLVVRFDLKPGAGKAFDKLAGATLEHIKDKEPGTLLYACHKVEDEPCARIFYELYTDRAAFDAHEAQPHTKHFLTEREQYFASPPRVEFFTSSIGKIYPIT